MVISQWSDRRTTQPLDRVTNSEKELPDLVGPALGDLHTPPGIAFASEALPFDIFGDHLFALDMRSTPKPGQFRLGEVPFYLDQILADDTVFGMGDPSCKITVVGH